MKKLLKGSIIAIALAAILGSVSVFAEEMPVEKPVVATGTPLWTEQFEETLDSDWMSAGWNGSLNVPSSSLSENSSYFLRLKSSNDFTTTKSLANPKSGKMLYHHSVAPWAKNSVLEVWFYDDASINFNNGYRPKYTVGTDNVLIGVIDAAEMKSDYYVYKAPVGNLAKSSIKRETGWHQFVFDYTEEGKVVLYIDGVKIYNGADVTGAKEGLYQIMMGSDNSQYTFGATQSEFLVDNVNVYNSIEDLKKSSSYAGAQPLKEQKFDKFFNFENWYSATSATTNPTVTTINQANRNAYTSINKQHSGMVSLKQTSDIWMLYWDYDNDSTTNTYYNDKVIEAWFYDDVSNNYGDTNRLTTNQLYCGSIHVGVYEKNDDPTSWDYYSVYNQTDSRIYTSIQRTTGWHQFVVSFNPVPIPGDEASFPEYYDTEVKVYIDEQLAYTGEIYDGYDQVMSVFIGDNLTSGYTPSNLYWDDLRIWENISDIPTLNLAPGEKIIDESGITFKTSALAVNNATDVALDENGFYVAFGRSIDPASLKAKHFELKDENGTKYEVVSITPKNNDNSLFEVVFDVELQKRVLYTFTVYGGYEILNYGKVFDEAVCNFLTVRDALDIDYIKITDGTTELTQLNGATTVVAEASVSYYAPSETSGKNVALFFVLYEDATVNNFSGEILKQIKLDKTSDSVSVSTDAMNPVSTVLTCTLDVTTDMLGSATDLSKCSIKAFVWETDVNSNLVFDDKIATLNYVNP